jgi:holo-[acyl-carrier protein] synthase
VIRGVGIDVVDNQRMKTALGRHPGIVHKILTKNEMSDLSIDTNSIGTFDDSLVASIAVRFAAKEALVKSVQKSLFSVGLHSIEILRDHQTGAPRISADFSENVSFLCSLSHSQASSVAVVIAQTETTLT